MSLDYVVDIRWLIHLLWRCMLPPIYKFLSLPLSGRLTFVSLYENITWQVFRSYFKLDFYRLDQGLDFLSTCFFDITVKSSIFHIKKSTVELNVKCQLFCLRSHYDDTLDFSWKQYLTSRRIWIQRKSSCYLMTSRSQARCRNDNEKSSWYLMANRSQVWHQKWCRKVKLLLDDKS